MQRQRSGVGAVGQYSRAEWELLTRLPGRIVVAATAAESGGTVSTTLDRHAVAAGLAGIDAIAAGRNSANPLVRNVVNSIYANEDDGPADASDGHAELLAECAAAATALPDRVDREAYAAWLAAIGSRVCRAARSGGHQSVVDKVSPAEAALLTDLATAFRR